MYERTTVKVIFENKNKPHFGIPKTELKIAKEKKILERERGKGESGKEGAKGGRWREGMSQEGR